MLVFPKVVEYMYMSITETYDLWTCMIYMSLYVYTSKRETEIYTYVHS
jgi:hypothetical protein